MYFEDKKILDWMLACPNHLISISFYLVFKRVYGKISLINEEGHVTIVWKTLGSIWSETLSSEGRSAPPALCL